MRKPTIVVVGATGTVGQVFLRIMAERNFPVNSLRLCASPRSIGTRIEVNGMEHEVQETKPEIFEGADFAVGQRFIVHDDTKAGGAGRKRNNPNPVTRAHQVVRAESAWMFHAPDPRLVIGPQIDVEHMIEARKPAMAFTLGGMGSAKTNFYNDAFRRSGYADTAEEVQSLWVNGKKEQAAKAVPDDMIIKNHLIGTEEMVRERLRDYHDAGVTTLRISTGGRDWKERAQTLEQAIDIVKSETGSWSGEAQ